MAKEYTEPYKEPKIILEVHRYEGTSFGSLIAVVEYEFKEKFYRRLEKISLKKAKGSEKWGMGKRKGLGLNDFIVILDKSPEIREALDDAAIQAGPAF
jgi:hypothetical protein